MILFFLVAFGDLCILLLDLVNFRDIDKGNVFLSVDLLKFETFVD